MKLVLFIGWVLVIFICSDLVGSALRFHLSLLPRRQASATGHGAVDFVHSSLLGFATLWFGLSMVYAIGIATRGVIIAFIGLSASAAALAQRQHVVGWARSQLTFWGLVGTAALLASFLTPIFNGADDPEYFFLINKLLRTGAIVEYFNLRRPLTLGGWTFIQAIFSAGPAGVAFVASIDAIVGSILFLFCAVLLRTGLWALPAALVGALVVQVFQENLGTAIGMAAMCSLLVGLSLPGCAPKNSFTSLAFAIMAVTIRPQLGLIAIVAIAVVLWRNRLASLPILGAIIGGISMVWVAIFLRDTGVLPLSTSPGVNPQFLEQTDVIRTSLQSKLQGAIATTLDLWQGGREIWAAANLTVLAVVICGWQSLTTKHGAAIRNEFLVLGAFCIAAAATVVGMIAAIGPRALSLERYYIPVVVGVLYVFLIRIAVHVLQRVSKRPSIVPLSVAGMTVMLCMAILMSVGSLSAPTESASRICGQLLTSEERRELERIPTGSGYTLLAIDCPVGSFETSSQVMINDLFVTTRGDYFDIDSDAEGTANWLKNHGVDKLVYLDNDAGPSFGLAIMRTKLERLNSADAEEYFGIIGTLQKKREYIYGVESLEKLRKVAQYCGSLQISTRDPQGPLVIVDLRQCRDRGS
jgi:hypothetical protein